jgi:hypothetical protein
LRKARNVAETEDNKKLLDWLDHKRTNRWILTCVCPATTKMSREDWFNTSSSTNIAESAHAHSQRDGIKLTLISAVNKGKRLDSHFFALEKAAVSFGISAKYGNQSMTGRAKQNLVRNNVRKQKQKQKEKTQMETEETMRMASEMTMAGISHKVIEQFLASKSSDRSI